MASPNLMARAAREIQAKNRTLANYRTNKRKESEQLLSYGGILGGGVAAAFVDSKWGDGDEPAELAGLPSNAVIGLAALAYGVLGPRSAPAKSLVGYTGAGMASAALYRYAFEKLEERGAAE